MVGSDDTYSKEPQNALGRDFFADSQMLAITHHQDCGLLFVKISLERESGLRSEEELALYRRKDMHNMIVDVDGCMQ